MSVRKLAGLAAAFALTVGLIGAGVSAAFTDSVTAKQNISVGTFACQIVAPSTGTIATDGKSVEFTSPTIMSSLPGNAPFDFTVKNVGSIPQALTVSATPLSAPWSDMLTDTGPVALPAGGTHTFAAGVAWTELDNSWPGKTGSIIYTVSCGEGPTISAVVSGPVVGDPGSPLAGQNVLKVTIQGLGFANGPTTVFDYDARPAFPGEHYADVEAAFGHANPTTSGFSVYFEENCSTGNPGPSIGIDVPFTLTATQGGPVLASFTGNLPCSLVH
jgi:predicted ribosomally synthesized peptide with SipW-like signal peptide